MHPCGRNKCEPEWAHEEARRVQTWMGVISTDMNELDRNGHARRWGVCDKASGHLLLGLYTKMSGWTQQGASIIEKLPLQFFSHFTLPFFSVKFDLRVEGVLPKFPSLNSFYFLQPIQLCIRRATWNLSFLPGVLVIQLIIDSPQVGPIRKSLKSNPTCVWLAQGSLLRILKDSVHPRFSNRIIIFLAYSRIRSIHASQIRIIIF